MISETPLSVRYSETDQMGVAHHASYFPWLEVARVELLRQLGLSYKTLESEGVFLPVVEVQCRYKAPLTFDDRFQIKTWLKEVSKLSVEIHYEIHFEGKKITEAMTKHVAIDSQGKVKAFPDSILKVLQTHQEVS